MYLMSCSFGLIVLCILIPVSQNILSLGSLLFFITIFMVMIISAFISSWYGFISFLIYITGLLVLFGYMLAMSSNSYYPKSNLVKFVTMLTIVSLFGMVMFFGKISKVWVSDMGSDKMVVMIYYNFGVLFYWFVAIFLFMALIIVVNMCYKSPKPLRSYLS